MSWLDKEVQEQNLQNYQSYKITQALKGRMTPSEADVIRALQKGKKYEKISYQKRKYT